MTALGDILAIVLKAECAERRYIDIVVASGYMGRRESCVTR
jgi:hypothetical protein